MEIESISLDSIPLNIDLDDFETAICNPQIYGLRVANRILDALSKDNEPQVSDVYGLIIIIEIGKKFDNIKKYQENACHDSKQDILSVLQKINARKEQLLQINHSLAKKMELLENILLTELS